VHSEEAKPIADVQIAIRPVDMGRSSQTLPNLEGVNDSLTARTDASGRWSCNEVLPNADDIFLILTHPEYVECRYSTDKVPRAATMDVRPVEMSELRAGKAMLAMKYGLLVAGILMNEKGEGVEGATISQIDKFSPSRILPTVATDSNGRFAFKDGRPGEMVLRAQAKGLAPEIRTVDVVPRMPMIEFRLGKGQIVSGGVIEEDGKPVAGATVSTAPTVSGPLLPAASDWEYFSWQDKTDVNGRFLWDSAPAKALHYTVRAEGFQPLLGAKIVLEPGRDHEIRLQRLPTMRLTGKVLDSKTRMPIEAFKVTANNGSYNSVEGIRGEFTLTLQDRSIGDLNLSMYVIRIEARGYRPDASQSVDVRNGDQNLEFALVRADGLSGTLKFPGGKPVAGAKVYLFGASAPLGPTGSAARMPLPPSMMSPGTLMYGRDLNASTATDESGKFSFDPMPEAHTVMAIYERGFAAATAEQLAASSTLTLEPWGRIEGTVRVGSQAGANVGVMLRSLIQQPAPPGLFVYLRVPTDTDGKFLFNMVPPDEYRVAVTSASVSGGASASAVVRAGETTYVALGGMGRPVVGRIAVAGTDVTINWKTAFPSMVLKLPGSPPTDAEAYYAWVQSEAGRNRLRSERLYHINVAQDDSFRVEDVLAGTYELTVFINSLGGQLVMGEVVVPEMPGGRSDTPLDLGVITFRLPVKK
jgi:hypothetical protein